MDGAKKNPVAATATGVVEGPYTGLGNGQEEIVSSAEMAAIRALDRKVTDGFNLVHGQFAVLRSERQEDREEFRDFRRQHRDGLSGNSRGNSRPTSPGWTLGRSSGRKRWKSGSTSV